MTGQLAPETCQRSGINIIVIVNQRLLAVRRDFACVASIAEPRSRDRQRRYAERRLRIPIPHGDKRLIVIALHIRLDPNDAMRTGELAGQVDGHQPGHAGGIAGVGLDGFPGSIVAPCARSPGG